ncbi:MAG: hypothetical protein WBQ39_04105 [Terriglobales bacterium]
MLAESSGDGLRSKRDRAILALLIGCGLRRAELVGLGPEDFQVREEHWVIETYRVASELPVIRSKFGSWDF